ncbi:MAG: CYTH domain-containing protein [Victivallales bacterium]|jgi:CYTH domain-containing protein|nr:CYTH domain-containing protein [Victivallales bacterium]
MGVEIERKFLLSSDTWRAEASSSVRIIQGYFEIAPGTPTVRVRIAGERAFLTIKGGVKNLSRSEFEYEIPVVDAEAMLREFCGTRIVEKTRYLVPYAGEVWEVDEYWGNNGGLFTAELELDNEQAEFAIPPWLGREVSDERRYSNGALSRNPYQNW